MLSPTVPLRNVLLGLVMAALGLPSVALVVLAVARVLSAMEDRAGAAVLDRVVLGLGILWLVSVVALVLVLAVRGLAEPQGPEEET